MTFFKGDIFMVWTCLCSVKCNKVKEESSKLSKQIKMLHKRKWKKNYQHLSLQKRLIVPSGFTPLSRLIHLSHEHSRGKLTETKKKLVTFSLNIAVSYRESNNIVTIYR